MQQNDFMPNTTALMAGYFNKASLPTQQQTLGEIVKEILCDGRSLTRKTLCTKLLARLELANGTDEEQHYQELIGLLFDR